MIAFDPSQANPGTNTLLDSSERGNMSNATLMARTEPAPTAATPALSVRRPLVWLLIVLAAGLGLRLFKLNNPLELDEFPPLYAVVERYNSSPDLTPVAAEPLKPVASMNEVRERSVLPYGIVQPVPVYHYLLYFVARTAAFKSSFLAHDWSIARGITVSRKPSETL